MRCSIIIPNYNYGDYVRLAIDSVLRQTHPAHEIIVVDDGSTDSSRAVLESYRDRATIIFQENSGQAAAISRGFAASSGDIVLLLDSDDLFHPEKLARIVALYAGHPTIGWAHHDLAVVGLGEAAALLDRPIAAADTRLVDDRAGMRRGKTSYDAPATSGLTFRRDTLTPIFPLPVAESITISDHYIKFFGLATQPGVHSREQLGVQLVHGANLYTGQKADATRSRIFINTAAELLKVVPQLRRFCNNLFVVGLVDAVKSGAYGKSRERVHAYLRQTRPVEWPLMLAKAMYHYVRR